MNVLFFIIFFRRTSAGGHLQAGLKRHKRTAQCSKQRLLVRVGKRILASHSEGHKEPEIGLLLLAESRVHHPRGAQARKATPRCKVHPSLDHLVDAL